MTATFTPQTLLDGRSPTAQDLSPLAFAGFAHFTAMQVRDRKVRGLHLHLARLRDASVAMFGTAMDDDRVGETLRGAVTQGPDDQSLTITMYSRNGEFSATGHDDDPAVLVRTAPPTDGPAGPLRLLTVRHQRDLPAIKHVGEVAKTLYLRQAVRAGFDDAAFVDADGRIGEATIWNLAFWDGRDVVWPDAAVLPGVTMQIVTRQLAGLGIGWRREVITQDRLGDFQGAAVMNSWTPGVPVRAIDGTDLPPAPDFIAALHAAYRREPAVAP